MVFYLPQVDIPEDKSPIIYSSEKVIKVKIRKKLKDENNENSNKIYRQHSKTTYFRKLVVCYCYRKLT